MVSRKMHHAYHWEVNTDDGLVIQQPKKGTVDSIKNAVRISLIPNIPHFNKIEYNIPKNSKLLFFKRNVIRTNPFSGSAIPVGLFFCIGYESNNKKHLKCVDAITKEEFEVIE